MAWETSEVIAWRDAWHGTKYIAVPVTEIGSVGERVIADWRFPTGWEHSRPDPSWPVPELSDA